MGSRCAEVLRGAVKATAVHAARQALIEVFADIVALSATLDHASKAAGANTGGSSDHAAACSAWLLDARAQRSP